MICGTHEQWEAIRDRRGRKFATARRFGEKTPGGKIFNDSLAGRGLGAKIFVMRFSPHSPRPAANRSRA